MVADYIIHSMAATADAAMGTASMVFPAALTVDPLPKKKKGRARRPALPFEPMEDQSFIPMIFFAIFFFASKSVRTVNMNRWVWGAPAPCQVPGP